MDFLTFFKSEYHYTKRGFVTESERKEVNDATTKAMKLLNSLIEANTNADVINEMSTLDFTFLIKKLRIEYENLLKTLKLDPKSVSPEAVTSRLRSDSFGPDILESFDVYILMASLADHNKKVADILKLAMSDEHPDVLESNALNFMKMNTGNVEIFF